MPRAVEPTDGERERGLGRIALWLSPEDLGWLASQCGCTEATADEDKERCGRVRFRASAALHKAGQKPAVDGAG
ncbi:hypothetical protein GCM10022251_55400 [Phytohabitans flavus]|uniref:Uncharacterized protein n=1 Tax=Phytohabitans flavus TaxID=1076124 RepID=A0A6F8XQB8_9ACTN|nr:hypothetical protein [Phytohabitans flavus]BCB75958.1 hypothetical protein Pflav_023680 [Phytohabitans flavus]